MYNMDLQNEELRLTQEFILKGNNEINKKVRNYGGYSEEIDFNKGCTVSPKPDTHDAYLYVASYFDTHESERPEGFSFKFYDKKVGVAYDVFKRMETLTNEIKVGRKNVLKTQKTHTPLYAKAIKCWKMGVKNTYRFEYYIHKLLDNRRTDGEWFTDYNEDILSIVEEELRKFVNNGAHIEICHMDEELAKNIHRFEKIIPTVPEEVEDENEVRYAVYRL